MKALILIIIASMFIGGTIVHIFKVIPIERNNMLDVEMINTSKYIDGYAYRDNYYCVWTKDKTEKQIENIDIHEKCHILISKNKKHFCN